MRSTLVILGLLLFIGACSLTPVKDPLQAVLDSDNPLIKRVMDNAQAHEIQILYTQIDRRNDSIVFIDFDFQVDSSNYFYPASTVKFPAAVATLEKLNEIDTLDMHTRFYVEGDTIETSFAKAISEIFAVSDNAANNRLIEFLGQDDLNKRMVDKHVGPIRIAHRLAAPDADNVTTKPLVIYINDSTTAMSETIINKPLEPLMVDRVKKGKGFYADDSLHLEPFDFS